MASVFVVVVCAFAAYGQTSLPGEIVDVLDGKTVVIVIPNGKVTVELQYIDVPVSGKMGDTVREHLKRMLLKKRVSYRAKNFEGDHTTGQLLLNNVDVSQQMLRDGAAWHMPAELSGQDPSEFEQYASVEAAAKRDRLGIWAVAGLVPSWERSATIASTNAVPRSSAPRMTAPTGYWGDENPRLANVGALQHGYNAATKRGYIGIPVLGVNDPNGFANEYVTGVDITYFYAEGRSGRTGYYALSLVSRASKWRFAKNNQLSVIIDGEWKRVGKPKRYARQDGGSFDERLVFQIDRQMMSRIANSNDVGVVVGDYPMMPTPGWQMLLYNLLEASR